MDGEVSGASVLPAASRARLLVCGDKPGKTSVRHIGPGETWDSKVCGVLTSASNPTGEVSADVQLGALETDLTVLLREACAPCVISGDHTGPCPHCVRYPGGCASVCAAGSVEPVER